MRIAIFSDIHANFPLEAVLASIASQHVDAVYCLGDLVGYAPFPNEVVERIRHEGIATIMGNYDDGVGFERDDCGCAYCEEEEKRRGIIVCGHTHKPYTTLVDGVLFVNVGSVGKPKDRNWRAGYAIVEPREQQPVTFVPLDYDIRTVTEAIRRSELPHEFADDLERAGAPAQVHRK